MDTVDEVNVTGHGSEIAVTPVTPWDTATWSGLRAIVKEDLAVYGPGVMHPGKHLLIVHRFGQWAHDPARSPVVRAVSRRLYAAANTLYIRNTLGFEVSHLTKIGRRVHFIHQGGVVLQPGAEIGDDSMIYHGVTMGRRWEENYAEDYHAPPRIGRGVHVGTGAVILGSVCIGDEAKIGPNAVVTVDVPAGASVVAPAARILRLR